LDIKRSALDREKVAKFFSVEPFGDTVNMADVTRKKCDIVSFIPALSILEHNLR
jgi:hypothetical protein